MLVFQQFSEDLNGDFWRSVLLGSNESFIYRRVNKNILEK